MVTIFVERELLPFLEDFGAHTVDDRDGLGGIEFCIVCDGVDLGLCIWICCGRLAEIENGT